MARNSVGWDWRYLGFPTKRAVFVRLDRVLYEGSGANVERERKELSRRGKK